MWKWLNGCEKGKVQVKNILFSLMEELASFQSANDLLPHSAYSGTLVANLIKLCK